MNDQDQKSGANSINLQAKGDITYNGLSVNEVKDLVLTILKSELFDYQREALGLIHSRIEHLSNRLISEIQSKLNSDFSAFKDPDFQYVLHKAGTQYARTGDLDAENLIIDLITERAKEKSRNIKQIVLNESLEIGSKLTVEQLKILASIFIPRHAVLRNTNFDELCKFLNDDLLSPFADIDFPNNNLNFIHLEFLGCITISIGSTTIAGIISESYGGMFSNGFELTSLPQELNRSEIVESCKNDPSKYQFKATTKIDIEEKLKTLGISDSIIQQAINLYQNTNKPAGEIIKILSSKCPQLETFNKRWDDSNASHSNLTSVGQALAISYLRSCGKNKFEFDIWLKN